MNTIFLAFKNGIRDRFPLETVKPVGSVRLSKHGLGSTDSLIKWVHLKRIENFGPYTLILFRIQPLIFLSYFISIHQNLHETHSTFMGLNLTRFIKLLNILVSFL